VNAIDTTLPNLLMLSGDTVLATGREGVFFGVLEEMARHFGRIAVISPPAHGAVTTRELFGNVFLHPNEGKKWKQLGHLTRTAAQLIAERPYAIITSHDYGVFYNGVAAYRLHRRFGLPYLSEIHHVPGHPRPADLRERVDKPLNRLYSRFAARHAAAIRVVNRIEMPELLRSFGVPSDKIRVIPSLYLDLDVFQPIDVETRFDVVLVGRCVVNKRFDLVLDAVKVLKDRGRTATVHLVGQGPLKDGLLDQAARLGIRDQVTHTAFLETTRDLAKAYSEARVLVCASSSEGGPRVTCEAMACGTPVVSTPVGIMTELIQHGENGYLVGWSAAEIADRLEDLLSQPERAAEMGQAGRTSVVPFERVKMIKNYADELKALAAEASSCA